MKQIKELDFLNEIDLENLKITVPVCIPTYKNREEKSKVNIIRKLDSLKDTEIYLFLYADDYIASGYDKLNLNKPNIHLVLAAPFMVLVRWCMKVTSGRSGASK